MASRAALSTFETLIGQQLGLITSVQTILLGAGQPRLFNVNTTVAHTDRYLGVECDKETGAAGYSYEHAAAAAIGELVERYCCGYCDPDSLVYASRRELGDSAVGMEVFKIHTEEQYDSPGWPFARPDVDAKIHWAKGESLVDGSLRHVPASLVYIPYQYQDRSDFLTLSVSSGNAAHTDPYKAVLTGLYEVVERDAFMITWLRKLRLPRVDYLADPYLADLHRRFYADCNAVFHVFDMTLDIGIPTYLCFCESTQAAGNFVVMGAATRSSPREAVSKAMLEAAQCLVWGRDLIRRKPDFDPGANWENIRDFEDRVRLFCEPKMMTHLAFLLDTPRQTALRPEPPEATATETIRRCVNLLTDVGLHPLVVDQTAPDVAATGFFAPKVMIPGTVPLTAIHRLPMSGSPRLHTAPIAARLDTDACDELNDIPHLFP